MTVFTALFELLVVLEWTRETTLNVLYHNSAARYKCKVNHSHQDLFSFSFFTSCLPVTNAMYLSYSLHVCPEICTVSVASMLVPLAECKIYQQTKEVVQVG